MASPRIESGADAGKLVSMLYRSKATVPFRGADLADLATGAAERNRVRKVTGALFHDDGRFLQWIEGPRESVRELFTEICRDSRHTDIDVVSFGSAGHRLFADWNLRLYRQGQTVPELLSGAARTLRYAGGPEAVSAMALELADGDSTGFLAALEAMDGDVAESVALCELLMGRYARLRADDAVNDAGLAIGLALIQGAFRRHSIHVRDYPSTERGKALFVAPVPGEPHILGAVLASTALRNDGFPVHYELPLDCRELGSLIGRQACQGVVLASSGVCARPERLDTIRAAAETVRRAAPGVRLALYGRVEHPDEAALRVTGVNAICRSTIQLSSYFDCSARRIH